MELHRPLIYLIGLDKGLYQVVHPVYVTADSPDALTFRIEADAESWGFDENLLDAAHILGRPPRTPGTPRGPQRPRPLQAPPLGVRREHPGRQPGLPRAHSLGRAAGA